MTTADSDLFVSLLAAVDALFTPMRDWKAPRPANTYAGRREFPTRGLHWRSGATSETGRKAAQRSVEGLAEAGLVKLGARGRSKLLYVSMPEDAYFQARRMCGLSGRAAAYRSLEQLAERSKRPAKVVDDCWIPETAPAGIEWGQPGAMIEFGAVAILMLPALVWGHAQSHTDRDGRVYYALTAAGWGRLDETPPPEDWDPDNETNVALHHLYDQRIEEALAELGTAKPADPNQIGGIPLPVCHVGTPLSIWTPHGIQQANEKARARR